jgi:hypothetical protein
MEFGLYVDMEKPDVIGITESWARDDIMRDVVRWVSCLEGIETNKIHGVVKSCYM